MITPEEFIARWGADDRPLVRFPEETVAALAIPEESKRFLTIAGLPEQAAPFLAFASSKGSIEMRTVADVYKLSGRFARYRQIGFDGSGNPIAIDQLADGAVVYLDHENRFAPTLMNSSVAQLAESILSYRNMVDAACETNEDAMLEGDLPAEIRTALAGELRRIDPSALDPGCFWSDELQTIEANAEAALAVPPRRGFLSWIRGVMRGQGSRR